MNYKTDLICFVVCSLALNKTAATQDEYLPLPPDTTTTEAPCSCQPIAKPICGSDGNLYINGCVANCEGVEQCCPKMPYDNTTPCICNGPYDACKV